MKHHKYIIIYGIKHLISHKIDSNDIHRRLMHNIKHKITCNKQKNEPKNKCMHQKTTLKNKKHISRNKTYKTQNKMKNKNQKIPLLPQNCLILTEKSTKITYPRRRAAPRNNKQQKQEVFREGPVNLLFKIFKENKKQIKNKN